MYEIPQQLEYKEKIVFNLTFGQLMYVLIFFPIAFVCFFRLNLPLSVRVFLTLIPVSLATGFMFLNLSSHLKNWLIWFKYRKVKTDLKFQKIFGSREIKEDYILVR